MHEDYLLDQIEFLKEKIEKLEKRVQQLEINNKTMKERIVDYGWNTLKVCTCTDISKPCSCGAFFKSI